MEKSKSDLNENLLAVNHRAQDDVISFGSWRTDLLPPDQLEKRRLKKIRTGLILLALLIFGYVGATEPVQSATRIVSEFPITVTIFFTATYVVWLPIALYFRGWREAKSIFGVTFWLAILWQWSQIMTISALAGMSVSVHTFLFQAQSAVVYALSVLVLGEKFLWAKVYMVVMSLLGVGVITFFSSNQEEGKPELFSAYVKTVFAMLLFCFYQILYAAKVPPLPLGSKWKDKIGYTALQLGMRGLHSILIGIPTILFFNEFADHPNSDFPNLKEKIVMLVTVLSNWTYNISFMMAIVQFSPLWVAMSQTLNIPSTVTFDVMFNGLELSWTAIMGALLVLMAFLWLNVIDIDKDHEEKMNLSSIQTSRMHSVDYGTDDSGDQEHNANISSRYENQDVSVKFRNEDANNSTLVQAIIPPTNANNRTILPKKITESIVTTSSRSERARVA